MYSDHYLIILRHIKFEFMCARFLQLENEIGTWVKLGPEAMSLLGYKSKEAYVLSFNKEKSMQLLLEKLVCK